MFRAPRESCLCGDFRRTGIADRIELKFESRPGEASRGEGGCTDRDNDGKAHVAEGDYLAPSSRSDQHLNAPRMGKDRLETVNGPRYIPLGQIFRERMHAPGAR